MESKRVLFVVQLWTSYNLVILTCYFVNLHWLRCMLSRRQGVEIGENQGNEAGKRERFEEKHELFWMSKENRNMCLENSASWSLGIILNNWTKSRVSSNDDTAQINYDVTPRIDDSHSVGHQKRTKSWDVMKLQQLKKDIMASGVLGTGLKLMYTHLSYDDFLLAVTNCVSTQQKGINQPQRALLHGIFLLAAGWRFEKLRPRWVWGPVFGWLKEWASRIKRI